ncbi:hypothetical protein JOE11_003525 [Robbsia andropogonis]
MQTVINAYSYASSLLLDSRPTDDSFTESDLKNSFPEGI